MDETKEPQLKIAQIFLAVANFMHRKDALQLPTATSVELSIAMKVTAVVGEDGSGGILSIEAKTDDALDPVYRFQIEMVALVEAEVPSPNLSVHDYLTKMGPTMLFPFLREAVAAVTGRGRFGAVWIKPMNLSNLSLEAETAGAAGPEAEGQSTPQG